MTNPPRLRPILIAIAVVAFLAWTLMAGPCTIFRSPGPVGSMTKATGTASGAPSAHVTTPLPPDMPRSELLPVSGVRIQFVPPGRYGTGTRDPSFVFLPVQVEITRGFWMCTTEISRDQWERIMQDGRPGWRGSDLPATHVSWDEAVACAERLGAMEGRKVRLPTEGEWELACRAGTSTHFWWGDASLRSHDNFGGRVGNRLEPVGFGLANPLGLFNMHGNVREWCQDWHTAWSGGIDPLCEDREKSDREAKRHFGQAGRVTRGGDYSAPPTWGGSSIRGSHQPESQYEYVGVRFLIEEVGHKGQSAPQPTADDAPRK